MPRLKSSLRSLLNNTVNTTGAAIVFNTIKVIELISGLLVKLFSTPSLHTSTYTGQYKNNHEQILVVTANTRYVINQSMRDYHIHCAL